MQEKNASEIEKLVKSRVRDIPDYPKPGIIFRDITPLLKDHATFSACIDELAKRLSDTKFDYVVGIEARGFIVGSALAHKMGKGFVPIRKSGKLPYKKISRDYFLEYGVETIEMHEDAIEKGSSVIIVDDLLATGGTAAASSQLIGDLGGNVAAFAFIVELLALKGRSKIDGNIIALAKY